MPKMTDVPITSTIQKSSGIGLTLHASCHPFGATVHIPDTSELEDEVSVELAGAVLQLPKPAQSL
jgi:hypothetical protein